MEGGENGRKFREKRKAERLRSRGKFGKNRIRVGYFNGLGRAQDASITARVANRQIPGKAPDYATQAESYESEIRDEEIRSQQNVHSNKSELDGYVVQVALQRPRAHYSRMHHIHVAHPRVSA